MFDTGVPENLEQIQPGEELGRVLACLDFEHLPDYELIRVIQAQDRQIAHYQAGRAWSMNQIATRYQDRYADDTFEAHEAVDGAAAEIAAALHLTRRSAEDQTGFALGLVRHRPKVFEALLFGRIDLYRAKILVQATLHLTDAAADMVLEEILPEAARLTAGELRHRLSKLCIDVDPETARKRYETALEGRHFEVRPNDSGTSDILGVDIAPHVAASIGRWIHREAIKLRNLGDSRTMDQLRADIYTDLLRRRYKNGKVTRADFGILDMKVTAETLIGQSEVSAELNGYGHVLADVAREVAEHQEHVERRWTLVDPDTGQPIDGGIIRRRPTNAQRRHLAALHPICLHPGCRMPAVDCDIDHRIPWIESKITCTAALGPMCRHHHTIRHKYHWTYQPVPGGDFLFTSPFGHRYTTSGQPATVAARSP